MKGINIRDLKRAKLAVAPFTEQVRIAEVIDGFAQIHAELRTRVEKGIAELREYRTALISAAVTGQIDVRTYRKEPEAVLETA